AHRPCGTSVRHARRIELERCRAVRRSTRAARAAKRVRGPEVRGLARVLARTNGLTDDLPREELGADANRSRVDLAAIEEHVDVRHDHVAEERDARLERRLRLDATGRQAAAASWRGRPRVDIGSE